MFETTVLELFRFYSWRQSKDDVLSVKSFTNVAGVAVLTNMNNVNSVILPIEIKRRIEMKHVWLTN